MKVSKINSEEKEGVSIEFSVDEVISELIVNDKYTTVEANIKAINDTSKANMFIDTVGEYKDRMFRVMSKESINKEVPLTQFYNILSLQMIFLTLSKALSDSGFVYHIGRMLFELRGEELTLKDIYLEGLKICAKTYSEVTDRIIEDTEKYNRFVGEIEIRNLKDL